MPVLVPPGSYFSIQFAYLAACDALPPAPALQSLPHAMASEGSPRPAPTWAPVHLAAGVLTLDVSADYVPTMRFDICIRDLPRSPDARPWTAEGLIAAIEDRACRRICSVMGVYLCGPAPAMRWGPSDPVLALFAPKFGTDAFWRRLQLHGAYRVCSFEWPPGMTLGAGPSERADTRPLARHPTLAESTASSETASSREEEPPASATSGPPGLP